MKRTDLMKRLARIAKRDGLELVMREGGSHTKVRIGDRIQTVPRHNEINEITARAIIRQMEADMKVIATAVRSGQWWAVEVASERGTLHTQTRRLAQVADWAMDAAAFGWDVPKDEIEIDVIPVLSGTEADAVRAAMEASRAAEVAAKNASRLSREAVALLRADGLTVRDVGTLLGVSPQRVSQLADR